MIDREPLRILQVVTYMGRGGLETMLMNYYRNIDRAKIQFDFLVHRDFRADYDDEIETLGGKIYHLPKMNPVSPHYRWRMDLFFKEHPEYRVVHVHQDCMSGIALKAAKQCEIPVRIAHSHSNSQDKNIKYPIKLFYRHMIPKYATDMLACGEQAGRWMFCGAPFCVLPNAIDTGNYQFDPVKRTKMRQELGVKDGELLVGHIGRFSYPKNHSFLLDVFSSLREKATAKLLLVGDGDLRPKMEEKSAQLGIRDDVLFSGIRSDVPDLLQAMDVFVFPSHYEGLPVTLVEAQAAGLPCVISDRVPRESIITENLVTVKRLDESAEAWADHIIQRFGETRTDHADEVIQAGYDIQNTAHWLGDFYLEQYRKHSFNDIHASL